MSVRKITALLGLGLLGISPLAEAQKLNRGQKHQDEQHSCRIVDIGLMKRLKQQQELESLRGFPSRPEDLNKIPFIREDRKSYVMRVAIAITGEGFRDEFQSNENTAKKYYDELETSLNGWYERDCGIRMELIRDEKLYLWKDKDVPFRPNYDEGTKLIDQAIGSENYDLGILITGSSGSLRGLGTLGGVQNHRTKADGITVAAHGTVAHELGHILGADHTHQNDPYSIQVEPGVGRSIMGYGVSHGRSFFALSSIQSIKLSCRNIKHYDPQDGKTVTNDITDSDTNGAKAIPFTETIPELDKTKLKPLYKVTRGTYYQFNIPVTNQQKGFLYNAHTVDREKDMGNPTNTIQPFYEPISSPSVMFHPRYSIAYYTASSHYKVWGEQKIDYSDRYLTGTFTYALTAMHKGQHTTYVTKLQVIDGEQFKIQSITGIDTKYEPTAYAGSPLTITWTPCHQLYKENKVRILLSDDFGQSFKYVLADNYPNTGSWSGAFPYATIGKTDYPSYTLAAKQSPIKNIRAGVIKIEVIGEVAYDLSHVQPYITQGVGTSIPTGGFLLKQEASKSLSFVRVDGQELPAQYVELPSRASLETKPRLRASLNGGQTQELEGSEDIAGNVITRKWTATIGGVTSTYTQVIKVLGEEVVETEHQRKLREITEEAKDLYRHIGSLAYPRADISLSKKYKELYPKVYTDTGDLQEQLDETNANELIKLFNSFAQLHEEDIVMPTSGAKYRIRSYHRTYGGDRYNYLIANPTALWHADKETTSTYANNGSKWLCKEVGGMYSFVADNHNLFLAQTLKGQNAARLLRGATWGAFSFVSYDKDRIASVSMNGKTLAFASEYKEKPTDRSVNKPGNVTSTDFQLELVDDDAFDIYFQASTWSNLSVAFVASGKPALQAEEQGDRRYRIRIPSGQGAERVRFSTDSGQSIEVLLSGVSATYSEAGRTHSLTVPESRYTTLYLDYTVALPQGVKAFTAQRQGRANNPEYGPKSYDLQLTPLAGVVPARTAVIIYAEQAGDYQLSESKKAVEPVRNNDLVGTTLALVGADLDHENYHHFDLTKPSGTPSQANSSLSYPKMNAGTQITANSAYLSIYKYSDGNYQDPSIYLDNSELNKEAAKQPNDDEEEKPEEPSKPSDPDPTPTPTPPVEPTPVDPVPNPPVYPPTPPSPTPPTTPKNPNDGGGDQDVDSTQDEDNEADPNGSTTGSPNEPDETASERGTLERPYSARGLTRHQVVQSQAVWVRGQALAWLDKQGQFTSVLTGVLALGSDERTFIPVYIPEAYRSEVQRIIQQELYVEGQLSQYMHRRGISPEGFRSIRVDRTTSLKPIDADSTASPFSPDSWRGYIYDLTGRIVGQGNFRSLPAGIYILGGKKYIKR